MYNKDKKRFSIVFDLDDTICYPNHDKSDTYSKYALAKPNTEIISHIRRLHHDGWYITIHSARRMLTHNGDINKIMRDIELVTVEWLDDFRVPYDELVFGKPYASHYYVDDKAMDLYRFNHFMRQYKLKDDELK